jgi:cell cycle checkpoint protein
MDDEELPLFNAVSSSARHLYLLLRCIGFSSKAQVQISEEGLRFSVQESSVMEGTAIESMKLRGHSR